MTYLFSAFDGDCCYISRGKKDFGQHEVYQHRNSFYAILDENSDVFKISEIDEHSNEGKAIKLGRNSPDAIAVRNLYIEDISYLEIAAEENRPYNREDFTDLV